MARLKPETVVVLRFRRPDPGDRKQVVEARDKADGALLFTDDVHGTAEWLTLMGYQYVTGSSAHWARAERVRG